MRLFARLLPPSVTLAAVLTLTPAPVRSQTLPVGHPLEEYARILELTGAASPGSIFVRPAPVWQGLSVPDTMAHPWRAHLAAHPWALPEGDGGARASLDPAGARLFFNSGYPWGGDDGAVWQGKGVTAAFDAGATLEWGPLTVTAHPVILYNQNAEFTLAPVTRTGATRYAYPWNGIDWPQRFGPDAFWTLDPGQSSVRLNLRGVSVAFGTENLWWGPGVQDAILMSDNAGGFPHGTLATAHPVDIGIGKVEAQWVWGRPQASEWADTVSDAWYSDNGLTDKRFFTGAVVSFKPRGLEAWTLGAARTFIEMVPSDGLGVGEYLLIFQRARKVDFITEENPTGQDQRDQVFSLFTRWAKPGSNFEVYLEWARNDHFYDLQNLVLEPEHSQGYTLGLRQLVPLANDRILSFQGELIHLEKPSTSRVLDYASYYAHWAVPPGYTQRGQILGAEVGPGGDGQHLGVDLYAPWGKAGFFVQRQVRDNDVYWQQFADSLGACCHDVLLSAGAHALWFAGGVDLGAAATLTREFNRYYIEDNVAWNLNLAFSIRGHRRALK